MSRTTTLRMWLPRDVSEAATAADFARSAADRSATGRPCSLGARMRSWLRNAIELCTLSDIGLGASYSVLHAPAPASDNEGPFWGGTHVGARRVSSGECDRPIAFQHLRPGSTPVARIRAFIPSSQDVRAHPTSVECEYQVVGSGPDRLLHLSTFGSATRQSERKSSQSLQLNLATARELVDIVVEAFPEIARP